MSCYNSEGSSRSIRTHMPTPKYDTTLVTSILTNWLKDNSWYHCNIISSKNKLNTDRMGIDWCLQVIVRQIRSTANSTNIQKISIFKLVSANKTLDVNILTSATVISRREIWEENVKRSFHGWARLAQQMQLRHL